MQVVLSITPITLNFSSGPVPRWLRALGINQSTFLEQSIGFVVRRVAMENIASAKLDDLITTHTTISTLKKASIVFSQHITDESGKTLCQADVTVACINFEKNKPCPIPAFILGALNSVS